VARGKAATFDAKDDVREASAEMGSQGSFCRHLCFKKLRATGGRGEAATYYASDEVRLVLE
jgi:hypothetical protein